MNNWHVESLYFYCLLVIEECCPSSKTTTTTSSFLSKVHRFASRSALRARKYMPVESRVTRLLVFHITKKHFGNFNFWSYELHIFVLLSRYQRCTVLRTR